MAGAQDEVAPFRLTDVSGDLSIRYLLDSWRDDNPAGDSRTISPVWEEELRIRTRSYVYHPAFLDMEIGGGPLLVQYGYESEQGNSDGSDTLFNFDAALNFLDRKAYPFTLFYRRDHPEIVTGLSGRFLAETDEYGVNGMLRAPLTPTQVFWEAAHWESHGSGFGTTIDEDVDRAELATTLNYRGDNTLGVRMGWNDRTSESGSPGLPIQQSEITTTTLDLDGHNAFGEERPGRVRQSFNWLRQETEVDTRSQEDLIGYKANALWQANEPTRLFGNVNYLDIDRDDSWTRAGDLSAGVDRTITDELLLTGEGRYSRDEAPGFDRDRAGGRATLSYRRPLPFGSLGASANGSLDRTDQNADADTVTVIDERHVLIGTVPVPLNQGFVVTDTVVVTNEPKTQTYVEGSDYRLVTVGATTTIERIITGSILDGEEVLVSYDFLTGGTVEYDTLVQSFSLNLGLFQWGNVYFQFSNLDNDVRSGTATTPLNDTRRFELGARVDYRLASGWVVGGEARHTDWNEDISPFVNDFFDVYVQTGRYWNTSVRVGAQRNIVNNENSPEDVDLVRYLVTVDTLLPGNVVAAYYFEHSSDDGGTIDSEDWRHTGRLDWGYRQVRFTIRAEYVDTTQGDNGRETTRVTAELRRSF